MASDRTTPVPPERVTSHERVLLALILAVQAVCTILVVLLLVDR